MLDFTPSTSTPYNPKRHVARLRRVARRRGFRILKDWTSTWSLVDTRVEPPRALIGLWQVDLVEIDAALSTPPPPPKLRRCKAKPIDAEFNPFEPEPVEPSSDVEVLQEQFDVAAILEELHLLKVRGR
jgi:hypothetical protein